MHKLFFTLLMVGACAGQGAQRRIDADPDTRNAFLGTYSDYDELADGPLHNQPGPVRPSRPRSTPDRRPLDHLLNQQDCRSKTHTRPHEKYCDLYYHTTGCDDGQALLRSCPNGLVFTGPGRHGLITNCDYPHRADCLGKEKHNPPISTEHCDWLYGIFGHETSCTRYWTCWNGTATEQFCVGGLLYNEETHACDWPQNVGGCQKHPLCKDDANGNVPLGKSCNRYWACQGGYPRLQRCPAMLVFDRTRKRCVAPPTEDCDVPPTTSRPNDDNENRDRQGQQQQQQQQQGEDRRRGGGGNERRVPINVKGALPFQLPEGAQLLSRPQN